MSTKTHTKPFITYHALERAVSRFGFSNYNEVALAWKIAHQKGIYLPSRNPERQFLVADNIVFVMNGKAVVTLFPLNK
jgi:hypothetical protein